MYTSYNSWNQVQFEYKMVKKNREKRLQIFPTSRTAPCTLMLMHLLSRKKKKKKKKESFLRPQWFFFLLHFTWSRDTYWFIKLQLYIHIYMHIYIYKLFSVSMCMSLWFLRDLVAEPFWHSVHLHQRLSVAPIPEVASMSNWFCKFLSEKPVWSAWFTS